MRWRSWWRGQLLARMGFRPAWIAAGRAPVRVFVRGRPGGGRTPAWIFVHGFADEACGWTPLVAELDAALGPQVLVDLPGHGASPLPDGGLRLDEMLQALASVIGQVAGDRTPLVLCGNSMGGVGAMRMAQRLAPRVVAQVLISPAGAPMTAQELAGVTGLFTLDSQAKARALIQRLLAAPPWPLGLYAWTLRAHMTQPALTELLATFGEARWLTADELGRMPPTLLIWGRDDTVLPASGLDYMRAHLPAGRTRIETPQRWGHVPFVDRPAEVAALIVGWAGGPGGPLALGADGASKSGGGA